MPDTALDPDKFRLICGSSVAPDRLASAGFVQSVYRFYIQYAGILCGKLRACASNKFSTFTLFCGCEVRLAHGNLRTY